MENDLERSAARTGPRPPIPQMRERVAPSPAAGPALRLLIEDIVADVFEVPAAELKLATRGKARIALARQVAMYIGHVGYGFTLTEVGHLFERDRTTVAHACSIVEQRRDDREFDAAVALLELIVRALDGAGAVTCVHEGCGSAGNGHAAS